jgi:hypothetical protein
VADGYGPEADSGTAARFIERPLVTFQIQEFKDLRIQG